MSSSCANRKWKPCWNRPDDSPDGLRDRALMELLYASGMRAGEAHDLDVQDMDLDEAEIRIRHGKGDKERVAMMGAIAVQTMREYLRTWTPHTCRAQRGQARPRRIPQQVRAQAFRPGHTPHFRQVFPPRLRTPENHAAHHAPLLRHAPAQSRRRHSRRAGTARTRPSHHHANLYARHPPSA